MPIAVLVIATARLPYGYYTFARIVVCAAAALLAYCEFNAGGSRRLFAAVFVLIAVLFNPIVPVHLTRSIWFYLDLIAAAVFAAHLLEAKIRQ
ncbi:MAG: hypothetical protein HXY30_16015 [Pseudorhodoplanes sp.]|nr:hypothetical protein [Pseudorhodoplanes sp.]